MRKRGQSPRFLVAVQPLRRFDVFDGLTYLAAPQAAPRLGQPLPTLFLQPSRVVQPLTLGFALMLFGFWVKARREESALSREFGPRFADHLSATGMFLPRVS